MTPTPDPVPVTVTREGLAAYLIEQGVAEDRRGYGHATGGQVADVVLMYLAAHGITVTEEGGDRG